MAYNEVTVVMGGLVHVPIVIGLFKFFDSLTVKGYKAQQAAIAEAEAKAKAEAAQKAKAEAEAKAKAKAAASEKNNSDAEG